MKSRRMQTETNHIFGELFVFLLLGMFAVFSLMTVVVGANVYRTVTQTTALERQAAVPLSYLANKVRSLDARGAVRVEAHDGIGDVLVLREEYGGDAIETRIFAQGGVLREQYGYAEDAFDPELSERLMDVEAFTAERTAKGIILSVCMRDGQQETLTLTLRSEG